MSSVNLFKILVEIVFELLFLKSFIIHYVQTKGVMTVTLFGYLILISTDFLFLGFLLSFKFDSEDISNTPDSVWQHFQTHRSSTKIFRHTSYFQLSFWCLEMLSNTISRVWYVRYSYIKTYIHTLLKLPSTGLFSHYVNYFITLVIKKIKLIYNNLIKSKYLVKNSW